MGRVPLLTVTGRIFSGIIINNEWTRSSGKYLLCSDRTWHDCAPGVNVKKEYEVAYGGISKGCGLQDKIVNTVKAITAISSTQW